MWRTSSTSRKESQFQFMNRIQYSSPHMFGMAASAYSLDYAHAFGVELVWQCQWFFETTTTGLDCIALFLRPLGKHRTWVYASEAKPCLDTKLFDACFQTKRTLQTHILQTLPTTLPWKTLLNRSGQRHAKTKTKEKNLNTVKAQPCWLNENRAPTGESTLAIVERRSCQSYLSA